MTMANKSKSYDTFESRENPEVYAVEVMRCIAQMKAEEVRLCREIKHFDEEKIELQRKIRDFSDSLAAIMAKIARKVEVLDRLKASIIETEDSYSKMIETSHMLYYNAKESKRQFLGEVKASPVSRKKKSNR